MTVQVRLFALYAELVGTEAVSIELPLGSKASDVVAYVRDSIPNGHKLPERPLIAVNLEHAREDWELRDGDELALLPPLAGG